MPIRQVNPTDYQNIYDLVQKAFETAQVSDGTEQDFVLKLRKSNNFIPELEFVAIEENELVGHIMLTKQDIQTPQGTFTGVLIAPLFVKREYRNQKIGQALMNYACQQALQLGYTAAFLVGNPDYYQRFGFQQTTIFHIDNQNKIPEQFVLACEFIPDALKNITGTICFQE